MAIDEEYKKKLTQRILQHNIAKQKKRKDQEDRLLLIVVSILFAILIAILLMITNNHDFKSQTCEECLDLCRAQHQHSTYAARAICSESCFEEYGGIIECIKVKDLP
jgi:hypothetical protein